MTLEIHFPKRESMLMTEAASWYRTMISLIPKIIIDEYIPSDNSEASSSKYEEEYGELWSCWTMKSRIRLIAAQSLCDASLANEFINGFPLPSIEEYIGKAYVFGAGKKVMQYAKSMVLKVSNIENDFANYGAGSLIIGLECKTSSGTWISTDKGWKIKDE